MANVGKAGVALLVALFIVGWSPSVASAATCSDYSNQADAQRAKDTRDADHDGIYCEALPCPCLKPGQSDGSTKPKSTTKTSRPRVGRTVLLGKRTKATHCHVRGPLPDPRCTPGSVYSKATPRVFCKSGYTKLARHVTAATKRNVFAAYGIKSHRSGQYEVDHLVPLELGGSNSVSNLFPEAVGPRPGFHDKDRLENKTHQRACAKHSSFRSLQKGIATDWTALYVQLIGRCLGPSRACELPGTLAEPASRTRQERPSGAPLFVGARAAARGPAVRFGHFRARLRPRDCPSRPLTISYLKRGS